MVTSAFNSKTIFLLTLLISTSLFTQVSSAEIFDTEETNTNSLDERIKQLEESIKIQKSSTANIQQRKLNFKSSVSGQLDSSALEQEVQELKGEVIEFNKELAILEENILSPVSTQVAIFLSIDNGSFFSLDGIKVELDGQVVEHHLYTKQEISALTKGAMQRLHTANMLTGDHEIVIILSGYSSDGRDVKKAASYQFFKPSSKKYIEFAINDNEDKQKVEFEFIEWQ